jgi:hypothetical protein
MGDFVTASHKTPPSSKLWGLQVLLGAVEILWALLSSTCSIIYGPAVYLWLAWLAESDRNNAKDNDDADADENEREDREEGDDEPTNLL